VLVVGSLGVVFQSGGNLYGSLLATGFVALLFQPLRQRLQMGVNRLMFGERDDPYAVLARLGERLENVAAPEAALLGIMETVRQALKLPYAAVALKEGQDFGLVATSGQEVREVLALPILYQAETVGTLILGQRSPHEPFGKADKRLLRQVAGQIGAVTYAARLTKELQASRTRLVSLREEERRRLRRDLHDGLGPILASHGLKLAAARRLLSADPRAAEGLLEEMLAQNEKTVAEVRRLVYALRPPALDELGLVAALRDLAANREVGSIGLTITVEVSPEGLPPLGAAVEVAAYRIVAEALTNVVHHAGATSCTVRFEALESSLRIDIVDDGRGLPEHLRGGVGLASMRERAEELGGTFKLLAAVGGGTRVSVALPLTEGA
jgi:signal transduction histidine kinase